MSWSRALFVSLALCCFGAACAMADEPAGTTASFQLPGDEFKFPLPEGYCLTTGEYDTRAKIVAQADNANLTDLSFAGCKEMAAGKELVTWGMIKTPLETLRTAGATRKEIVDYFKSQVDPKILQGLIDEGAKSSEGQIQKLFGVDAKTAVNLKPLETDDLAAYIGGTVSMSADGNASAEATCVFAMTAVKGRVFLLYLYAPYNGASDVVSLLAKVKDMTAAFVAANGG